MRRLTVFNSISLDGYFTDAHGDMSFAKGDPHDAEWNAFVGGNASGDGTLLFGRKTYEMMASFWPTPMAAQMMPDVAAGMNRLRKVVFSRSLSAATWNNTTLIAGDLVDAVRALKSGPGQGMVILGSGTIVAQLTQARLIDEYQFVVCPVVLGAGRTMFDGVTDLLALRRIESRAFANGNVFLRYEPVA
ncbi:MAG: dihydrofolate reductase [Gemmatimonadetes bacterium]|nr:dihydrofolate reductase [Gemmatimonadota bacterium]